MDKTLFAINVTEDGEMINQKGYLYNDNGKLIKFGKVKSFNPTMETIDIKSKHGVILKKINKRNLNAEIEDATNEEMLEEIDMQMKLYENAKVKLEKETKMQNEKLLNLLKTIINKINDKEIISVIEDFDLNIIDAFHNKFRYCDTCMQYTEISEYEDEVYDSQCNDYILKQFYRCKECYNYYD